MAELFGRIFGNPKPERDEIDTSGLEDDTEVEFDTEEEEGGGDGADEFGDYDDEAKTHIETVINKRLQAQRDQDFATMRLNAQARGLDFTADGQILPADYQKIQGWLPQQQQAAPAFQPQQQTAAQKQAALYGALGGLGGAGLYGMSSGKLGGLFQNNKVA